MRFGWNSPTQLWHVATQLLEEIKAEQSILLALLLEWECLVTSRGGGHEQAYNLCPSNLVLRGKHSYNLPLILIFTTFEPRWKIRTTPQTNGEGHARCPRRGSSSTFQLTKLL
jgi:hypothetical protein